MKTKKKATEKKRMIFGQPSWHFTSSTVEAYVTEQGVHLAPVIFNLKGRKIQPYAISPWSKEKFDEDIPQILRVLRGDFLCMPFGGNERPYLREKNPPHGEMANQKWKFISTNWQGDRTIRNIKKLRINE